MYSVAVINRENGTVLFKRSQFFYAFLNAPTTIEDLKQEILNVAISEGCIKKEDVDKYDVFVESDS
ncbi:hypothetical protein C8J31_101176 [Rhizobium sp. PP-CC-2G-626]|nr:hypothetical protein C8J31_101176 [Rhizobium sp. PP-CC-2G-626]